MNATTVLFCYGFGIGGDAHPVVILVMLYMLSFLMVSTIKYNSFKKAELFKKMNFNVLVAAILILIFIAAQPSIALFILGLAYVISGPIDTLRHYREIKRKKNESHNSKEQNLETDLKANSKQI
jgi:CDP-diacylglycerol--serine O-phosphatidyltransferase